MELPVGASISLEEIKRVEDAVAALASDHHASREMTISVTLHVHHEYPKHVKVGEDKEGNPITKIVYSAEEESGSRPASRASRPRLSDMEAK